jgi:hypothetical protein
MTPGEIITAQMESIEADGLLLRPTLDPEIELYCQPDLKQPFQPGKILKVYVWGRDRDGRWTGSLKLPAVGLNQVEFLQVKSEMRGSFFLDWGMEKDLYLPESQVSGLIRPGMWIPVRLIEDKRSDKPMATMKWKAGCVEVTEEIEKGTEVEILVMEPHELGYIVLADHVYVGIVYSNQVFQKIRTGQRMKAWVNKVREDGKIDFLLRKPGYGETRSATQVLLDKLEAAQGGKVMLGDKSPADLISEELGMSKKTFKMALGALYKQGQIRMNDTSFWLVDDIEE